MLIALGILFAFVLVALIATVLRAPDREGERGAPVVVRSPDEIVTASPRPLVRKHPFLPFVAAVVAGTALYFTLDLYPAIAGAIGGIVGCIVWIGLRFWASMRVSRFELELTEAIDLMVSTLRAGGGLSDALTSAIRESRRPLRSILQEVLDRIQVGEDPESVLANLEKRVSLESFRLFSFTLSTHWSGGGSLATTLSNVGRTIRDRVDVLRRVKSQAIESQVSAILVLLITYGLALLSWASYPDRFEVFVSSELGAMFIAAAIFAQAVGLFWITMMTRIEV